MIYLPRDKRASFFLLLLLTVLVLIGMLYFGVRLKGFRPGNNVRWSSSGVGLVFDRFAQAYTDGFFSPAGVRSSGAELTIELAIRPDFPKHSGFRFLVLVHDGEDKVQLVIGQWRSSLVIMNGDDFSNRQRAPKIYFDLRRDDGKPHFISIVSNKAGTRLYYDGALKKRNTEMVLRYPQRLAQTRLVVGNSLSGNHPWTGTMLGLAFYDRGLGQEVVQRHYRSWRLAPDFGGFLPDGPRLLYAFDEGKGEIVYNKAGSGADLHVPAWMTVLQTKVLSWPRSEEIAGAAMVEDVMVNLAGFVPLGFLLIAMLSRFDGGDNRTGQIIAILIACLFSLSIEIAQVWIPTRDSSMLDLILNTLGGGAGVMLFRWKRKQVGL